MFLARAASLLILPILLAGCRDETAKPVRSPQQVPQLRIVELPEPARPPVDRTEQVQKPRYLIIHADDAGLCRSVNSATIDAMERGVVSSASMMVPCPAFEEFAEYARHHPEKDFGIHLTLNAEFRSHRWGPVLPRSEVPGLCDSQGFLWAEPSQTAANARADEVERELTAQIERALALKVPVSHLDSHMGTLLLRPDFLDVYVNLALKYSLPILFVRTGEAFHSFQVFNGIDRSVREISTKLERNNLPVLEQIRMRYAFDSLSQRYTIYRDTVRGLPPGVSELIVHCGYADEELYAVTGSAPQRDADRRVMMDPEFRRELELNGIKILNWRQFREMAQSTRADAMPGVVHPASENSP